jgi:hypothetical protein
MAVCPKELSNQAPFLKKNGKKRKKLYEFGVKVTIYGKNVKDFGVIWYRIPADRENFGCPMSGSQKSRPISEAQDIFPISGSQKIRLISGAENNCPMSRVQKI